MGREHQRDADGRPRQQVGIVLQRELAVDVEVLDRAGGGRGIALARRDDPPERRRGGVGLLPAGDRGADRRKAVPRRVRPPVEQDDPLARPAAHGAPDRRVQLEAHDVGVRHGVGAGHEGGQLLGIDQGDGPVAVAVGRLRHPVLRGPAVEVRLVVLDQVDDLAPDPEIGGLPRLEFVGVDRRPPGGGDEHVAGTHVQFAALLIRHVDHDPGEIGAGPEADEAVAREGQHRFEVEGAGLADDPQVDGPAQRLGDLLEDSDRRGDPAEAQFRLQGGDDQVEARAGAAVRPRRDGREVAEQRPALQGRQPVVQEGAADPQEVLRQVPLGERRHQGLGRHAVGAPDLGPAVAPALHEIEDRPLDRVGGRAVDLAGLGREVPPVEPLVEQPAQGVAAAPVEGAGGEFEHQFLAQADPGAAEQAAGGVVVAAPVQEAAHRLEMLGVDQSDVRIGEKPEDRAHDLRRAQQGVEEVAPPGGEPALVRRLLGMDVQEDRIGLEHAGEPDQHRRDVAPDVGEHLDAHAAGMPGEGRRNRGPLGLRVGGDEQVGADRDVGEIIADLVAEVRVVDVRDHRHALGQPGRIGGVAEGDLEGEVGGAPGPRALHRSVERGQVRRAPVALPRGRHRPGMRPLRGPGVRQVRLDGRAQRRIGVQRRAPAPRVGLCQPVAQELDLQEGEAAGRKAQPVLDRRVDGTAEAAGRREQHLDGEPGPLQGLDRHEFVGIDHRLLVAQAAHAVPESLHVGRGEAGSLDGDEVAHQVMLHLMAVGQRDHVAGAGADARDHGLEPLRVGGAVDAVVGQDQEPGLPEVGEGGERRGPGGEVPAVVAAHDQALDGLAPGRQGPVEAVRGDRQDDGDASATKRLDVEPDMLGDGPVPRIGHEHADLAPGQIGCAADLVGDVEDRAIRGLGVGRPDRTAVGTAEDQVVRQGLPAGLDGVAVPEGVPAPVEGRMRVAALGGARAQVVDQGVLAGLAQGLVVGDVPVGVEERIGVVAEGGAAHDVMGERRQADAVEVRQRLAVIRVVEQRVRVAAAPLQVVLQRCGEVAVGVAAPIPGGVEERMGAAPLLGPVSDVVGQRVVAGRAHVRVPFQIPAHVEQGMRVAALPVAAVEEMQKRVDAALGQVRMIARVPGRIEQRVGRPALARALAQVVLGRIGDGGGKLGIGREIPVRVEHPPDLCQVRILRGPGRDELAPPALARTQEGSGDGVEVPRQPRPPAPVLAVRAGRGARALRSGFRRARRRGSGCLAFVHSVQDPVVPADRTPPAPSSPGAYREWRPA
ncbi:hypothetical protein MPOCJGCO_4327 [Methylobacterium trifolii]|uniref:Uncharacterized protein n=1 Tax=Methylobacterium trifolii TaxID=1003092 RepID=A0ABQ4U711_9HYPH|nr:hypothetical protein MPOCJGCO_4327 [Methylobacterium trifolii]